MMLLRKYTGYYEYILKQNVFSCFPDNKSRKIVMIILSLIFRDCDKGNVKVSYQRNQIDQNLLIKFSESELTVNMMMVNIHDTLIMIQNIIILDNANICSY